MCCDVTLVRRVLVQAVLVQAWKCFAVLIKEPTLDVTACDNEQDSVFHYLVRATCYVLPPCLTMADAGPR